MSFYNLIYSKILFDEDLDWGLGSIYNIDEVEKIANIINNGVVELQNNPIAFFEITERFVKSFVEFIVKMAFKKINHNSLNFSTINDFAKEFLQEYQFAKSAKFLLKKLIDNNIVKQNNEIQYYFNYDVKIKDNSQTAKLINYFNNYFSAKNQTDFYRNKEYLHLMKNSFKKINSNTELFLFDIETARNTIQLTLKSVLNYIGNKKNINNVVQNMLKDIIKDFEIYVLGGAKKIVYFDHKIEKPIVDVFNSFKQALVKIKINIKIKED